MTVSLEEYVETNRQNTRFSVAVCISGLPYLWTDGLATWNDSDHPVVKSGALIERPSLKIASNPMKPLTSGNGTSVRLADDFTGYLAKLFSPLYGNSTRLTGDFDVYAGSFTVLDGSVFTAPCDLYVGQETISVSSISGDTININQRKLYGSSKTNIKVTGKYGPVVSDSPRVFRNRFVEIKLGVVDEFTGAVEADNVWTIWSGTVDAISNDSNTYTVSCETLTKAVEGGWPKRMASGVLGTSDKWSPTVWLGTEHFSINLYYRSSTWNSTAAASLGMYSTSGVFYELDKNPGYYDLDYVLRALSDTIIYNSAGHIGKNEFNFRVESYLSASYKIYYTNLSDTSVFILQNGFFDVFQTSGGSIGIHALTHNAIDRHVYTKVSSLLRVNEGATKIPVVLDDPKLSFDPDFETERGVGYALIKGGDFFEVVRFSSVTTNYEDSSRIVLNLSNERDRGIGSTNAVNWAEVASDSEVTVSQVWMLEEEYGIGYSVADILLRLLLSTGDFGSSSTYDFLSYDASLGIPERFVDITGMKAACEQANVQGLIAFWLEPNKEGGKELVKLLKALGVYLVTRRFVDQNGIWRFGISLRAISVPSATGGILTLQDKDRLQNSKVVVDYNERLLVNKVEIKLQKLYGETKDSNTVTEYAEDSIFDYGIADTLELDPPIEIAAASADGALPTIYTPRQVRAAIATNVALRWFAAFSGGNYTITVNTPHTGWKYQVGDRVSITLTGVKDTSGVGDMSNVVGEVTSVAYSLSGDMRCTVILRLGYKEVKELVPCASVYSFPSPTSIGLDANTYSNADSPAPFAVHGFGAVARDVAWFDPEVHSDDVKARLFLVKDPATYQDVTITAISITNSEATTIETIDPVFTAAVSAGDEVVLTFSPYSIANSFQRQYAYIGDTPKDEYV